MTNNLNVEFLDGIPETNAPDIERDTTHKLPSVQDTLGVDLDPTAELDDNYFSGLENIPDGKYRIDGQMASLGLGEDFGTDAVVMVEALQPGEDVTDPIVGTKINPGTKVARIGGNVIALSSLKLHLTRPEYMDAEIEIPQITTWPTEAKTGQSDSDVIDIKEEDLVSEINIDEEDLEPVIDIKEEDL